MDYKIERVIKLLQQEKQLPEEYLDVLFPTQHKEYELTYQGKKRKQQILSSADEPQSVPFQIQKQFGVSDGWNNLLIFGDNYQILKTMYENKDELIKDRVKGKVKLIYIDPPFATSDEFSNKQGAKAYSDKVKGAEFIEFLRQRLILARELLSDDGSIFVHLDNKMSHYAKVILDEVFGKNNFRNEIVWTYNGKGLANSKKSFINYNANILFYSKSDNLYLNNKKDEISKSVLARFGKYMNENNQITFGTLRKSNEKAELSKALKRFVKKNNKEPNDDDIAADYNKGTLIKNIWDDIAIIRENNIYEEYINYPTQKPEKLLERIIKATTVEDDLVMDFFAGSGTTGFVAEKLNRRWIMCDIGKLSMYTIRKRFLTKEDGYKPFALVNAAIYDLTEVFNFDKVKYDAFVKNLFHIDAENKNIAGVTVNGKRRGDWVKIFDFHYFQDKGNITAINEKYIEDLHKQIGKKVGNKFYLVAPEINIDIIDNYIELDGVRYYLLRIPYQAIKELHKADFKKPQQPNSKMNINSIETSVGFYFNEPPEVKSLLKIEDGEIIVNIESIKPQYESSSVVENILAMILIDTADGEEFVVQNYYFADEIRSKERDIEYQIRLNKNELKTNSLRIVYIDIFGNEFIETLEAE